MSNKPKTNQIELSIVIPAYNEEKKIKKDITKAFQFFKKEKMRGEVIVSTDGVTDNTNKIVKRLQKKYKNLILLAKKNKIGKGAAIKRGIKIAKGKYIMFADAGYCVPFSYIKTGLKLLKNGNDCAIASRAEKESQINQKQPLYRQLGSKLFGFIVRNLIGIPKNIKDTQCGFKLYTQETAKKIYQELRTTSFMFDIEIILRAQKENYSTSTFPINWKNDNDTKFNPISGSIQNLWDLFKIKTKYKL